ncbi:MAG: ADP-ribosylation factor-like protein [Promethearchaeota archaeon]
MENLEELREEIIKGIIYSVFETEGPTPIVTIPETIPIHNQMLISMKSISLLMGEQVYQEGREVASIKYFGILPFPDLFITSLTFFFLISDEDARGQAKAATISLLVKDTYSSILYEQMKDLSVLIANSADKITKQTTKDEAYNHILDLYEQIEVYLKKANAPMSTERNLKILFTGLDASGKTSYLRAIKQKFSELTNIKPTKGVERQEETILGQDIMEWDVGGQRIYRDNFLKQADLYLYDTNLLFYLVDIKDKERYDEAFDFLKSIVAILESFNQFPPIVVNLHKVDPDIEDIPEVQTDLQHLKNHFTLIGKKFQMKFFHTSIFNPYSLTKSFSEGIGAMSPNREILRGQLKWLANQLNAEAVLLINNSSIILSDYSTNTLKGRVSEISAPHFQNLFRTFSDFKLLKRNKAIWRMDEEVIVFIKIEIKLDSIFLLVLLKDHYGMVEEIEKILPYFTSRIDPLIKSYL